MQKSLETKSNFTWASLNTPFAHFPPLKMTLLSIAHGVKSATAYIIIYMTLQLSLRFLPYSGLSLSSIFLKIINNSSSSNNGIHNNDAYLILVGIDVVILIRVIRLSFSFSW